MIKVLYDHQNFSIQRYGGITRYFAGLMQSVKDDPAFTYQLSALYTNNAYIKDEPLPLNNFLGKLLLDAKAHRRYKWNKQYSKYIIGKNNYDLLHPTYFHPYFLKQLKKPYVLTIYDMIYEVLPEHFSIGDQIPYQKKISANSATAIVAISESTRQDIIRLLNVPPENVVTIHLGLDLARPLIVAPIPNLPKNFILYVGERNNYKNFFRFLEASAQLLHENKDLHIICGGGGNFQFSDTLAIERLKIADRCIQLNVNDDQMNYLYQQAQVFVFPSLYEGFGYPLLEAFKANCPVAASNTSCFPEIGGDAVAYFDPYDVGSIYTTIKSVLTDSQQRSALMLKGTNRLQHFDAKNTGTKTLALYSKIVNG